MILKSKLGVVSVFFTTYDGESLYPFNYEFSDLMGYSVDYFPPSLKGWVQTTWSDDVGRSLICRCEQSLRFHSYCILVCPATKKTRSVFINNS